MLKTVFAQYFQTGQDPASIKWRQIHTNNFQLIYPDYYEEQAQELAGKLEKVYEYGSYTLNHSPKKISVILHTQTVVSNGLVAWAPKRAEFYTTPHQSIYPQDWLEQLVLHEYRHVVQVDKVNSHIPGIIKTILGEQGTALIFGAYLPWWFIEGDAVVTETSLSKYGRGRFPSFLMEHRAQVVQKSVFSYDKAYFGSFRDFVPNHYKLGYYMVGAARARYGSQIWDNVLNHAGENPFSFFPMNKVLKEQTGFKKDELYRSVFDSLRNVWVAEDEHFTPAQFLQVTSPSQNFSSYMYSSWISDSVLISLKESFDGIPVFIRINKKGEEKKLFFPGTVFNESVSIHGNRIVWSERIPDPRWSHSGKSLIRIYNTDTQQKVEIEPEFKSFSPALSRNRDKIVVVETDFSNNYFLSVYSVPGGELLYRYQTPQNNYFFSPRWLDDQKVVAVTLAEDGKRMVIVDFENEELEVLLQKDLGDVKHLRLSGNYLYFISSYSGKNSLYRLNLKNKIVKQVFEPRFGVEHPAITEDGKKIVLSDYTAHGYRLIQISSTNKKIVPLDKIQPANYKLADALAKQEVGIPDFSGTDSITYESKKYSKPAHLMNFHSWAPLYIDASAYEISPGVSVMSQNKLGTAEMVLGYKWDLTEETGKFLANYKFLGWYPVFNFNVSSGNRASKYYELRHIRNNKGQVTAIDTTLKRYTWGEWQGRADISLPLNFGKGRFNRFLQPEIHYDFTNYKRHENTPENFNVGNFHTLSYRLYYHQLMKKSYQDMYPDFGFILDATYRHSPAGKLNPGTLAGAESVIYLPGLMKNHGIKIYGGAQQTHNSSSLGYSDVVNYARGWGRINTNNLYTATADYKLPLLYPDFNFFELVYLKRLKVALFGDFTRLEGNYYRDGELSGTFIKDITSVGAELTADANLLRFYAPANMGLRASYLPELNSVYFDFLFSIDFTSF
jgi:hypothetical protein